MILTGASCCWIYPSTCIAAADSREALLAFSATGRIFSLVLVSIVCKIGSLNIL